MSSFLERIMIEDASFATGLSAPDKSSAIQLMVRLTLQDKDYSTDRVETIANEVIRRENIGSTGIGFGVAYPHCKTLASDLHFGLFTFPTGVEFDALDSEPVFLLACLISPRERPGDHLRVLERFSRIAKHEAAYSRLAGSRSALELREALRSALLAYAR